MKISKTNQPINQHTPRQPLLTGLFVFMAALTGTAVGFVAALAVALPVIHHDLAAQTKQLGDRLVSSVSTTQADDSLTAACAAPAGSEEGQVLGAATTQGTLPGGGAGGGQQGGNAGNGNSNGNSGGQGGGGNQTFVQKLVGGAMVKEVASINNTGPQSTNEINNTTEATTKITNNNYVNIASDNHQSAISGDATVTDNTNAGAATSGPASNTSDSQLNLHITN